METVKGAFQSLKHEIEVHLGGDSGHPSVDPKKLQVAESHEHEHKPEPSSIAKNHIKSDPEVMIQVDSGLQHADLSSVLAKEELKVGSKSVSPSTHGIVSTTAAAEEVHTANYHDSKKKMHEEGQVQVQVQERAFQVLARGAKAPTVKSGSPGQYH